jgi:hypothetical protein
MQGGQEHIEETEERNTERLSCNVYDALEGGLVSETGVSGQRGSNVWDMIFQRARI